MADPAYIVDGVLTDPEAWVAIKKTGPLSSSASDVTWTSPDDASSLDWSQFMDLVIIAYCRASSGTNIQYHINFNDSTGNIYAFQRFYGDGSNAEAFTEMNNTRAEIHFVPGDSVSDGNIFGSVITNIADINSAKAKTMVSLVGNDQNGAGTVSVFANEWRLITMDPIKKIKIWPSSGNWMVGSRFDLFGILPRMVG